MDDERSRCRILVVDDDPDLRRGVADILREAGFDVADAPAGRLAVEALESFRPRIIVADVWAPLRDDFALLESNRCEYGTIPFLLLATGMTENLDAAARYFGAVGVLRKPVDPADLLDRIDEFARRAASGDVVQNERA